MVFMEKYSVCDVCSDGIPGFNGRQVFPFQKKFGF
jgi:hypothetical protein